jgi:hypothetical protein
MEEPVTFIDLWDEQAEWVNTLAHDKGWYDPPKTDGESILLMHNELSEAVEAIRLPEPPRSTKIPDFLLEEEELADVVIRIMDYSHEKGLRVGAAIKAKHLYNVGRPHRHGGKRL